MDRWMVAMLCASACGSDDGTTSDSGSTLDVTACQWGDAPEVFLGSGVGGAFVPLVDGQTLGLTAAPQGGFGVSVLVGTRGLQAGAEEVVTATLTASSPAVKTSAATFTLDASLQCKLDGEGGPHGIIYGVVVGFSSSLSNNDLLAMNGQPAELVVDVTDANGVNASVTQNVTLIVGK